jgi:hypothetical protein
VDEGHSPDKKRRWHFLPHLVQTTSIGVAFGLAVEGTKSLRISKSPKAVELPQQGNTMVRLVVQQNETQYVGAFARPPFSLWGDGKALLEGLHDAFTDFRVTLKDFRVDGTPDDPVSQTVKVFIGPRGQYRFRFDRVEATMTNSSLDELRLLPSLLGSGASWLREVVQGFKFQSHLFSYGAHYTVLDGTAETYLNGLSTNSLPPLGTAKGTGVIFHADNQKRAWRLQLTVDHSLLIDNGLFIQFALFVMQDELNYEELFREAETILRDSFTSLNLTVQE